MEPDRERPKEQASGHGPPADLLESIHEFPGTYRIKVIGLAHNEFEARAIEAVVAEVAGPSEIDSSTRATKSGRHVALTLDITVQSAEQVRRIYAGLREVEGLTLLL